MTSGLWANSTLLDIFQFAGQGTAEQGSAVHFGTHLKNVVQ